MKLAWFSPLPPERSEIANHTRRLAPALEAAFETRFYTEKPVGFTRGVEGRAFPASVGEVPTGLLLELNALDLPVYNLGNHPGFFSHTWFLSQAKPGIVVLHDLKFHHFFEGIYRERLGDQASYLKVMRQHYGSLGYEAGIAYWRQEVSIDFMAEHFPMLEWVSRGALGIVVHTEHAREVIRKVTDVPVVVAPLPYLPRAVERPTAPEHPGTSRADASETARLILFGHLNVNRRVVEFLTALATMPERRRFEVEIFGEMLHQREVETAVGALGLAAQVKLHGYVPDAELDAGLARADLAVNLRFPSMGEASASQLRIWDHALPSLVTLTEGYAGLPPETVFFVRPEEEAADIQRHLRTLLTDPGKFREAGQRGRQWLCEHHRPAVYVERVGQLCRAADALRSRYSQLRLADRVGAAIAPWIDATSAIAPEALYASVISEAV